MNAVTFKGTREGVSITLGDGSWREIMNDLGTLLNRPSTRSFFRGARVRLDTGRRTIEVAQIEELIALLTQHEMTLVSVQGTLPSQAAFAKLRTILPPTESSEPYPSTPPATPEVLPLVIRRTVRSGQVIQHTGAVIIVGDVNPGASVIADGDVIVWGKIRGIVHAGACGNDLAFVGALVLTPTQLRIGHYRSHAPTENRTLRWPAEIARVKHGQIQIEPWGS